MTYQSPGCERSWALNAATGSSSTSGSSSVACSTSSTGSAGTSAAASSETSASGASASASEEPAAGTSTARADARASSSSVSAAPCSGSCDSYDTANLLSENRVCCGGRPASRPTGGAVDQRLKIKNVNLPMPKSTTVTNAMTIATKTRTTPV